MSTSFAFTPIVTDGLVLYLDAANTKSYISGSTDWYDLTTYNNDGTLTNGPTFSSTNGGSIVFDGVDDYVVIVNNVSLNPTNTISLCAWIKYNGNYSGVNSPIIFKKNNGVSYFEQYIIACNPDGTVGLALGDGVFNDYITSSLSYTNQLINVVGTINNGFLSLYVDGVLVTSKNTSYTSMDLSTNPVIIGAYNESFSGYFGGDIYNVSIYNRVLSNAEILQNYNATKWRYK